MSKMKRLPKNNLVGFIAFLIGWLFLLAFFTTFLIHPAHAYAIGESQAVKPQPNQRPHYLYQVKDGYLKSFTEHKDRVSCLNTAAELKLKSGTWKCLPR